MKVNLLISDDEELRAAVREMIQAEVLSIARANVREILAQAIGEKVSNKENIDHIIHVEVSNLIKSAFRSWGNSDEEVKRIARQEIQKFLNDTVGTTIKIA